MTVAHEQPLKSASPWVLTQLQRLLAQRGHAQLVAGSAGLNQFELSLALAKTWLCDQPQSNPTQACHVCGSCQMFEAHTHPDFRLLLPEDIANHLGWDFAVQGGAESSSTKKNASREIKVDALKHVVEFTQRTCARSATKVVLIYPADRMNLIAANTLLKTLEEPPGNTRFILVTENLHRLLPTIKSRCQLYVMRWPEHEEALQWLQAQGVEQAEVLLAAAGGKPEQALQLIQMGFDAQRWLAIPQLLRDGNEAVFEGLSIREMLGITNKLCHDLMCSVYGGTPRYFSLSVLPQKVKEKAVVAWSKELMQALKTADHPWNAPLYQKSLTATAQRILQG